MRRPASFPSARRTFPSSAWDRTRITSFSARREIPTTSRRVPAGRAAAPPLRLRQACCLSPTGTIWADRFGTRPTSTTSSRCVRPSGSCPLHLTRFQGSASTSTVRSRDRCPIWHLMSVMAGPDPRDQDCFTSDPSVFTQPLDRDCAARVAWCLDLGGFLSIAARQVIERQRQTFESLGCLVEEACPDLSDADEIFLTIRPARRRRPRPVACRPSP